MLVHNTTNSIFEKATLVHSGEDYFSRLERIIVESKIEIHIQTYIFDYDSIGQRIIAALKAAATRNVKIYILIDGFGSLSFPTEIIDELSEIGIELRIFSSFFSAVCALLSNHSCTQAGGVS